MKYFLISVFILISLKEGFSQKKTLSLEVGVNVGAEWFSSIDKIDEQLINFGYPKLASNLNVIQAGGGNMKFRFGRFGIFTSNYKAYLYTEPDINKHYYNGTIYTSNLGFSYDVVQTNFFILSPFISAGGSRMDMYLDYVLEDGVTPTSLKIRGVSSGFLMGTSMYFKVKSWKDKKYQLFIMSEASYSIYSIYTNGVWRFNNMRINSQDFNLSSVNVFCGVSLKYTFKNREKEEG